MPFSFSFTRRVLIEPRAFPPFTQTQRVKEKEKGRPGVKMAWHPFFIRECREFISAPGGVKMKSLVLSAIFVLSILLASSFSMAQSLTVEQVTIRGSGCPEGTASATLSPDGKALSVLYSDFLVEGSGSAEKTCQVVVRMRAPKGYKVHMARADLRGFNGLPAGARSRFETSIRFTDWRDWTQAQTFSQNFTGPLADDFFQALATPYSKWGNCGGMQFSIVLDTRFSLSNPSAESALLSLDSSDIMAGPASVYHLGLESCKGGNGNGNGNGNNGRGNGRGRVL